MSITKKMQTFSFMFKKKPFQALELLNIRIERELGVPLFFLSVRRLMTYIFETFTTRDVQGELDEYGNYYLRSSLIPKAATVFSLGVGDDITFDLAFLDRHPNAKLILVDPTPKSRDFLKDHNLPENVHFSPVAVADRDGTIDVFTDDLEDSLDKTSSVSIYNRGFHNKSFKVDCKSIGTLMKEYDVSHIDVLKMDIEGAGVTVLSALLNAGIYPTQIAGEFERPEKLKDVYDYLRTLHDLFSQLKNAGYEIYRTRPTDKGCQIEIAAVRQGHNERQANPTLH